jgi:hypothetical protein
MRNFSVLNKHGSPELVGRFGTKLCGLILVMAWALIASIMSYGQGATGSINGVVTDPSGAVVPGAKVVLHNVATRP